VGWNKICEENAHSTLVACGESDDCVKAYADSILFCPCRQNNFSGCPARGMDCRPHVDPASAPIQDIIPNVDPDVFTGYLFYSDEFDTDLESQWSLESSNKEDPNNYEISDGVLSMKYTHSNGQFKGHDRMYDYSKTSSNRDIDLPMYGYWEASIDVDEVRNGRACTFYLLPERYNLNPDDSTDPTARKGARINIMNQGVWPDNKYSAGIQWDTVTDGLTSEGQDIDAPGLAEGFHTFGLLWTEEKITWFYDGAEVHSTDNPDLIPNQYPLYPRLESEIVSWLIGGPDESDPWPADCKVDYIRYFMFDRVNPHCEKFDTAEMEKCEEHYRAQAGDDSKRAEKMIADNCPCHANCYFGCANCGSWECSDSAFIDAETPKNAQPDGVGLEHQGRHYELYFSDEFNGPALNSNKWHISNELSKVRKIYETQTDVPTAYQARNSYTDGNGNLVQRWLKNPDPESEDDPEDFWGAWFSAGKITTKGIFSPIYGWFEAKIDTVPTNGCQTAWWLWPDNALWNYTKNECPSPNNAWYGSEIDIIEARKFGDECSTNIHFGGYNGGVGCYENDHTDEPVPGLHDGFHTLGLRWSDTNGGMLEWFYDGKLIRTLDDPLRVSRAATHLIMSGGMFTDPDYMDWNFVDGRMDEIPDEDFPLYHYVDYIRYWREVDKPVGPTDDPDEDDLEAHCEENPVDHYTKGKRATIFRKGTNSYTLRLRVPAVPEETDYSGVFMWGKKNCGADFIAKLASGEILVDVNDNFAQYKMVGYANGGEGQHANVAFQYNTIIDPQPCGGDNKCLGNANKDQLEIVMIGTGNVNWGKKDPDTCLLSIRAGYLGANKDAQHNEEDQTTCVSWANKFW